MCSGESSHTVIPPRVSSEHPSSTKSSSLRIHSKAQHYNDSMDVAERAYTDNVMPNDAEGARQLLNLLHDHKRTVLEASMHTLQEAQSLLGRLRNMTTEGATLDSRPLQIRTNIDFGESHAFLSMDVFHSETIRWWYSLFGFVIYVRA